MIKQNNNNTIKCINRLIRCYCVFQGKYKIVACVLYCYLLLLLLPIENAHLFNNGLHTVHIILLFIRIMILLSRIKFHSIISNFSYEWKIDVCIHASYLTIFHYIPFSQPFSAIDWRREWEKKIRKRYACACWTLILWAIRRCRPRSFSTVTVLYIYIYIHIPLRIFFLSLICKNKKISNRS